MIEQLITFETAKSAKEKGFNEFCMENFDINGKSSLFTGYAIMKKYHKNSTIHLYDTNTEEFEHPNLLCTAPTQSLLQKYLREVHNIEIYVIPIFREKCGYDSFRRDGFGFEIIQSTPCQYLDWTYFEQCGEEREAILNNDDYNDLDIQIKFKTFQTYEEALEIGLQEALKLI